MTFLYRKLCPRNEKMKGEKGQGDKGILRRRNSIVERIAVVLHHMR